MGKGESEILGHFWVMFRTEKWFDKNVMIKFELPEFLK